MVRKSGGTCFEAWTPQHAPTRCLLKICSVPVAKARRLRGRRLTPHAREGVTGAPTSINLRVCGGDRRPPGLRKKMPASCSDTVAATAAAKIRAEARVTSVCVHVEAAEGAGRTASGRAASEQAPAARAVAEYIRESRCAVPPARHCARLCLSLPPAMPAPRTAGSTPAPAAPTGGQ